MSGNRATSGSVPALGRPRTGAGRARCRPSLRSRRRRRGGCSLAWSPMCMGGAGAPRSTRRRCPSPRRACGAPPALGASSATRSRSMRRRGFSPRGPTRCSRRCTTRRMGCTGGRRSGGGRSFFGAGCRLERGRVGCPAPRTERLAPCAERLAPFFSHRSRPPSRGWGAASRNSHAERFAEEALAFWRLGASTSPAVSLSGFDGYLHPNQAGPAPEALNLAGTRRRSRARGSASARRGRSCTRARATGP